MEIRKLNIQQLINLLDSEEANNWPVLPISRLRLLSQSKNPHLQPNDIVMILLLENGTLAGFMGAMPDELNDQQGRHHVAWASCIWIDPAQRGKGLGKLLTTELFNAWDGKMFLTEFTPTAEAIYRSMGCFESFLQKKGFRFFYRSIFHSLGKQRGKKPFLLFPLRLIDFFINILQSIGIGLFPKENKKAAQQFRIIDPARYKSWSKSQSVFHQNKHKWEWITAYPWLSHDPSTKEKRYFFPTYVDRFRLEAATIADTGTILYTIYNNDMKIIDAEYWGSAKEEKLFVDAITCFICTNNIDTVLSYSDTFNNLFTRRQALYFFKKKRTREYLVGSSFMKNLTLSSSPDVEEYDGDVFFT